jgi:hypothetical protein
MGSLISEPKGRRMRTAQKTKFLLIPARRHGGNSIPAFPARFGTAEQPAVGSTQEKT